jgi:ParB/RepB/Spo0J family partition protein
MLITRVRVADVVPHPHNIRRDVGDVGELAETFKTSGMLQPLVVAPHIPARRTRFAPKYVLIVGHRRLAAAKVCGWDDVDVVVRDDLDTEAKQTEAMLVENLQRTNLSPMEEADAYEQLQAFDYTPEQIAERTGRSLKLVQSRLALRKLSAPVASKVHAGQISLGDAELLAGFDGAPAIVKKLEKAIGTPNFRHVVEQAKREQQRARAQERLKGRVAKRGFTLVPSPAGYDNGRSKGWVELQDIFDVPERNPYTAGFGEQVMKAHQATGCTHGAVFMEPYSDVARYVCRKPAEHPKKKQAKPRETAEQRRRRLEVAREREELETSSAARLAFVKELRAGKALDVTPLLRMHVRDQVRDLNQPKHVKAACETLGLPTTQDFAASRDLLLDLVAGLKQPSAIAAVSLIIRAVVREDALLNRYSWPHGAEVWIGLLREYGYEPSDLEKQLLEPQVVTAVASDEQNEDGDGELLGLCKVCGCTDDDECDGGCVWMNHERTLCSACATAAEQGGDDGDEDERAVEDVTPVGEFADAV